MLAIMSAPLSAVGLAAAIVHAIEFSVSILLEDHAIHHGPSGGFPDNHVVLRGIVDTLQRLTSKITNNHQRALGPDKKAAKLSEAAQHLLKLGDETTGLTNLVTDAVLRVRDRVSYGDSRWATTRDALLVVWKEKEITSVKKRFGAVRKELDGTLLLALRQELDHSSEKSLPLFEVDDSRNRHWERWQSDAMDAIHANDWRPKNKKHVEDFSSYVDRLVLSEEKVHFSNEIFANLHFDEQDDRLHNIAAPHERSFKWIFDSRHQKEGSFLEWLGSTNGQNLFWVTGKPGSGKSTLMKYLFRNDRLFPRLEKWSGNSPGILTGFFLWNCGTDPQKTSLGLLRSLLYETLQDMIYGPLELDPGIIKVLFDDRWKQFTSFGGGLHNFALSELRKSFELLVSDDSKRFLFMIDGLDELDDSPTNVLDILLSVSKLENVKICVSSRPLSVFQRAFEKSPRLELDMCTRGGILSYVLYAFDQNDTMFNIPAEQSDGTEERAIINTLVEKASGVFLWASLATEFLIQSTSESDDVATIRDRVDTLPYELDDLLSYIFDSLESRHMVKAAKLIRLVDVHGYPGLLPLCFAMDADTKSGISAEICPLTTSEAMQRVEDMRNLLKFICKNLLSIFEALPSDDSTRGTTNLQNFKVNYAHRCIRDFIQSDAMRNRINQAIGYNIFNADENWANANLWTLKTLRPGADGMQIWHLLADSIELALRLEASSKCVRFTYLDELAATLSAHLAAVLAANMDFPPGASVHSFLDIALWLNLSGYVSIRARTADRKDLHHAVKYSKELRKRLGVGGEVKWIGGRSRLKDAYAKSDPELDALLEYYTKAVKLVSPKPLVGLPEWV